MLAPAEAPPILGAQRRLWRDPFVIAFVLGALAITILPFMQRLTLRAPPPLERLGAWSLDSARPAPSRALSRDALLGTVWLASFVPVACDAECARSQTLFVGAARHLDDLGDRAALVSFLHPGAQMPQLETIPDRWTPLTGDGAAMETILSTFDRAWQKQVAAVSTRAVAFEARPSFAVIDQDGSIRGFWPADDEGRGLAINAARMLARYGKAP